MLLISIALTLFLVFDPLGNLPLYAMALRSVPPKKHLRIIVREIFISLLILMFFLYTGDCIFKYMQISRSSLGIAGGIVLFIISLKMIFPSKDCAETDTDKQEPFIVPLAVPLFAGPASITSVILIRANHADHFSTCVFAFLLAWGAASIILLLTDVMTRVLGNKVLQAGERLMGMLLTAISVEMLIGGLKQALISVE
jgi:MarC family membrane protein